MLTQACLQIVQWQWTVIHAMKVKYTEAQEAGHIHETLNQQNTSVQHRDIVVALSRQLKFKQMIVDTFQLLQLHSGSLFY